MLRTITVLTFLFTLGTMSSAWAFTIPFKAVVGQDVDQPADPGQIDLLVEFETDLEPTLIGSEPVNRFETARLRN